MYNADRQMDVQIYKYGDAVRTIFSTIRCEHTKMNTIKTRNRDAPIRERERERDGKRERHMTATYICTQILRCKDAIKP
jgi:hypothetical protein